MRLLEQSAWFSESQFFPYKPAVGRGCSLPLALARVPTAYTPKHPIPPSSVNRHAALRNPKLNLQNQQGNIVRKSVGKIAARYTGSDSDNLL